MKALLLDIGGVLELTPEAHWVAKWEVRLGLRPGGLAEVVSPIWRPGRTGETSLGEIERATAAALRLSTDDAEELWNNMWDWYLHVLNHELVDYLATLRPQYVTAILSNSFVGAREREESRYGFAESFDPIIYSHEEGMEKPDPAFYRLACKRLGVAATEIVFVDDTPDHVAAAESIGMKGMVFTDTPTAISAIAHRLSA